MSTDPIELNPSTRAPRLRVRGVQKRFTIGSSSARHDVHALRGVDLEIDGPGFFAVMGASGSGKSTLLHLLAGLDRVDAGEIEVQEQRVDAMSESQLTQYRRRSIGIVFQQFNLLSAMSALENVLLPSELDNAPRDAMRARATALLEQFGLAERMQHRPDALSGGEQQRVAIARALLFSPPVLFADEPTGSLDSEHGQRLAQLLRTLAEEQRTLILMVTHEASIAMHCERVFVLRDGVLAGSFATKGLDAGELALRAQELSRTTK
ncbi:MAG: ABC transporter ATP-binding protein [Phycisphaerales bacterium]|nr:ABC transporter ATP-binding protein [Phycisphaerales bacterium]